MTLADRVDKDLVQALKQRNNTRLSTLRLLKAAAQHAQVAKRAALTDAEYQDVVTRQAKLRREAAAEYDRAGRGDKAAQERAELQVLEAYLPEQLGADELRAVIEQAIEQTNATGPRDLGKVMSMLMPAVKGKADGTQVNALVRELLAHRVG